jgi:hypothetical protein
MWDKNWPFRLLLLFVVLLPTLIVLLLQTWFNIDRSLFVYDYFIIGFLIAFNVRSIWLWLVFVFVLVLDIAILFSKLYLFNLFDFLSTLRYFSNYTASPNQLIILITVFLLLISVFFLLIAIKRNIGGDKVSLKIFAAIFASIFALDNINGSSILFDNYPSFNFYKSNFAGSPSILLYHNLVNINLSVNAPLLSTFSEESITFKEYKKDSTSDEMLIIIESFGLISDSLKREEFQKGINSVYESKNWKISWGKTSFSGSTTRAELRELLNCVGDYRYFINPNQAKNFNSIFQIKKKQGYHTNAIHSYKANMFERAVWWKNIGVNQAFFSEDVQIAYNFQTKLSYESPFISLVDEDAFNYIQDKIPVKGKHFVYFLTENSHLPFKGIPSKPSASHFFDIDKETNLSEEAKNQSKRISELLIHVATHLDHDKFQKLLIVGDHMPPFVNKNDRLFYSDKFVPYCIISR